jgi:very-short-patch-repair endonuclease
MPEPVESWWRRRQFSRGVEMPYPIGAYREQWAPFPVLVKQYHPDLNRGIVLSQVPPAADVWLIWQRDVGHTFVATPFEQRSRPGRGRRRSVWCPDCAELANPGARKSRPKQRICPITPALPPGEPFASECAPRPASAAEPELRARLLSRLEFSEDCNAVRVARPFFDHYEVWPDIVIPELKVAIEYDSTGRDGLEHVGRREESDRRKDRTLRATGWEVVRVRTGKLQPLGPHDVMCSGVTKALVPRILDELRTIRGDLIVDCYLR